MLNREKETRNVDAAFWQQWQRYKEELYRCCLLRMGGNPTDAEDALSAAMLRGREALRKGTKPIENFKAWLWRLTDNLCKDILEGRDRRALAVEDVDAIAPCQEWGSEESTPALVAVGRELELFFESAILELPERLRETFILYSQEQLSYQEIAGRLKICRDNARKRVSEARSILRRRYQEYEAGGERAVSETETGGESRVLLVEEEGPCLSHGHNDANLHGPELGQPKQSLKGPSLSLRGGDMDLNLHGPELGQPKQSLGTRAKLIRHTEQTRCLFYGAPVSRVAQIFWPTYLRGPWLSLRGGGIRINLYGQELGQPKQSLKGPWLPIIFYLLPINHYSDRRRVWADTGGRVSF